MKKRFIVVSIALLGAIILALLGSLILPDPDKVQPIDNAAEIYAQAASLVANSTDLSLTISRTQETAIEDEIFQESAIQRLICLGLGTESMQASLTETFSIDSHSVEIVEVYTDDTVYAVIDGSTFKSTLSPEDYQTRFSPAVLLNTECYSFITGGKNRDGYVIFFHNATVPESWTAISAEEFISAQGTAYIDTDGTLTHSTYTATYSRADAQITLTVDVDLTAPVETVNVPENTDAYITIDDPDAPRILERVSGYLLQAENISAHYTDNAYFQAFGDERTQTIDLSINRESDWTAHLVTNMSLTNTGREGEVSHLNKAETFRDNTYSVCVDGGEPTINKDITKDAMRSYCRDILLGTVMLPQYITDAKITDEGNTILVTYSGNETFAQQISSSTCQSLYQTPDLLDQQAESHTTDKLQCYVQLDKALGLPVASGISYSGTYTLEGLPYTLRFQADQIYTIATTETAPDTNETAG